jgi:hypothetical protein
MLFALCLLGLNACSNSTSPVPDFEDYLEHTVSMRGETLGIIAGWYTGTQANWRELRTLNANSSTIRIGDSVYVPRVLLKRSTPMTREYLNKVSRAPNAPTNADTKSPEASEFKPLDGSGDSAYGGAY